MKSIWRTVDPGLVRDVAAIAAAVAVVGLSFGAIGVTSGLPGWLMAVMSVCVFAGGAQFLTVGLLAAGSPLGALLGGLLLNARHLAFGFALAGQRPGPAEVGPDDARSAEAGLAGGGLPGRGPGDGKPAGPVDTQVIGRSWPARLLGSHLMVDESVAFALAQPDPARRRAAYWLTGAVLFVVWNLGTGLGVLVGGAVADPARFGLDAALPAGLLALLWPSLRDPVARRVALVGSAMALLTTPVLPAGAPVLLALTGLAVAGFGRRPRRPAGVDAEAAMEGGTA